MLVIEDDPIVARFAHRWLMRVGCHVATATTCGEARRLRDCGMRFQFALVDVGLPDGCGFSVGEELIASAATRQIIYYTGHQRELASERGTRAELSGPILSKDDAMRAIIDAVRELSPREDSRTRVELASAANEDSARSQGSAMIVELEDGLITVDTNPEWVRVWVFGRERVLSPDLCALLCLFAKNRGTLFPKHQICKLALDNRALSSGAITKQIQRLRDALPEAAHLIREQHGRYGFL